MALCNYMLTIINVDIICVYHIHFLHKTFINLTIR